MRKYGSYYVSWALRNHWQPQWQNSVHGAGTGQTLVDRFTVATVHTGKSPV